MTSATQTIAPPSRLLQFLELGAGTEAALTALAWPWLQFTPRGDGHSVLVLPGLVASDTSTVPLRAFLQGRGYDVHGWGQGRNFGPRDGVVDGMLQQLDELHATSGRKVTVIGWSLGGVYARMLARERPDAVRSIITLGSPLGGSPRATNAWRLYEFVSGRKADDHEQWQRAEQTQSVPSTSIWSRTDGVVAWQVSQQPESGSAENIRVYASHLGIGCNPSTFYALADRLAQPEGEWKPFAAPALLKPWFPAA